MDAKIIVNAEVLNPVHVPETLPYREKELALVSKNATNGVNTFVWGPPGCGKTALIELARKVREEKRRGKQQNMTEDELAFYDALGVNDSAVQVLGNETLRKIALELTQMIHKSVTIDWTQRESVQAEMRLKVRKILRKYGYPPDKEEKATQTVIQQAELIAKDWIPVMAT